MTIHLGKGTMTVKSVDGFEYQYDVSSVQFEPEYTVDSPFVVDESTHFKYAHLTFKIQMATPPKNKPYYRQFEKRGKW